MESRAPAFTGCETSKVFRAGKGDGLAGRR